MSNRRDAKEEYIGMSLSLAVPILVVPSLAVSFFGMINSEVLGEEISLWAPWAFIVFINCVFGFYYWIAEVDFDSARGEVTFIRPKAWLGALVVILHLLLSALTLLDHSVFKTRGGADIMFLLLALFVIGFLQSLMRSIFSDRKEKYRDYEKYPTLKSLPYAVITFTILAFMAMGSVLNIRLFQAFWTSQSGGFSSFVPHFSFVLPVLAISVFSFQPEITKIMFLDVIIFSVLLAVPVFLLYSGLLNIALVGENPLSNFGVVKLFSVGIFGTAFLLRTLSLVRESL